MATYEAHFSITNRRGNNFSCVDSFFVHGLSKVRIKEIEEERFEDGFGIEKRYQAKSGKPFVIVITSKDWSRMYDEVRDDSRIYTVEGKEKFFPAP